MSLVISCPGSFLYFPSLPPVHHQVDTQLYLKHLFPWCSAHVYMAKQPWAEPCGTLSQINLPSFWLLSVRKANIPCFSYIAEKISHPLCQWATNRRVERNCTTPSSEKLEGGWVLPYLRSREKKYYETKNKKNRRQASFKLGSLWVAQA